MHPQPIHDARLQAYRAEHAEGRQQLYNQRAGVEGTISQAVRGTGLRHARYVGLAKSHVQNVVGGIAINLCRLGAYYADRPKTPRPPTRIHRLCIEHDIILSPI